MVKKLVTGFAISVGAGLAIAATSVAGKNKSGLWHPANTEGALTPVTIRVHTAIPRSEPTRPQLTAPVSENPAAAAIPEETPSTLQRSAELAEIKVMIGALDQRSNEMMDAVNQRIDDLEKHLPRFIDVKVSSRIREVEERLRTEFQEEQSKMLDAFLQTLEQKVLPRLSLLEEAAVSQRAEIGQMRRRIEKTDETLDRVSERIEKVVDSMVTALPVYSNAHVTEINQKAVA